MIRASICILLAYVLCTIATISAADASGSATSTTSTATTTTGHLRALKATKAPTAKANTMPPNVTKMPTKSRRSKKGTKATKKAPKSSKKEQKATKAKSNKAPTASPTMLNSPSCTDVAIIQVGDAIEAEVSQTYFGGSVSTSANGMTIAVGGPVINNYRGHVKVFAFIVNEMKWMQMGSDIHGTSANNAFGYSVSLSNNGNRLAISAPDNYNDRGDYAGYARVFDFDSDQDQWIQVGSDILGAAADDELRQVRLSGDGNTVAVSFPFNNDNGYSAGKVRVYQLVGDNWIQIGGDTMTGLNSDDWFGENGLAISTDGTTVAAGSWNKEYVKVFTLVNGEWSLLGGVITSTDDEDFGVSLDLSDDGRRIVVGAVYNSYDGLTFRGRAVVYEYTDDSASWETVGESLYGENIVDQFGMSVSINGDGNRVAIGAPLNDGNGSLGSEVGHVRVFDFDGDTWIQVNEDIDGDSAYDWSGSSVALSNDGNFVAVGAPAFKFGGDLMGSARVYEIQCQE